MAVRGPQRWRETDVVGQVSAVRMIATTAMSKTRERAANIRRRSVTGGSERG